MQDDSSTTADSDKPMALYAAPVRAGLVGLFLLASGLGIAALPFIQISSDAGFRATPIAALMALTFVAFGLLVAYPGFQFLRLVATATPFITTDGTTVRRARLGLGRTELAWEHAGEIGLRGIWIILVDGRVRQGRVRRSIMGTQGLWLPALLVHGGGTATMKFIEAHKRALIEPLFMKVATGRAGGRR